MCTYVLMCLGNGNQKMAINHFHLLSLDSVDPDEIAEISGSLPQSHSANFVPPSPNFGPRTPNFVSPPPSFVSPPPSFVSPPPSMPPRYGPPSPQLAPPPPLPPPGAEGYSDDDDQVSLTHTHSHTYAFQNYNVLLVWLTVRYNFKAYINCQWVLLFVTSLSRSTMMGWARMTTHLMITTHSSVRPQCFG